MSFAELQGSQESFPDLHFCDPGFQQSLGVLGSGTNSISSLLSLITRQMSLKTALSSPVYEQFIVVTVQPLGLINLSEAAERQWTHLKT